MDFDKIKSNWQDSFKDDSLRDEQISLIDMVKGKSDPIMKKIMRNYIYSLVSTLSMYAIMIFSLFIFMESTMVYLLAFLISASFGIGTWYSIKSLLKIKKSLRTDQSVKT